MLRMALLLMFAFPLLGGASLDPASEVAIYRFFRHPSFGSVDLAAYKLENGLWAAKQLDRK